MIKKNTRNKIINSEYFFIKNIMNKQNINSFKNEIYANKYLKNKKNLTYLK